MCFEHGIFSSRSLCDLVMLALTAVLKKLAGHSGAIEVAVAAMISACDRCFYENSSINDSRVMMALANLTVGNGEND